MTMVTRTGWSKIYRVNCRLFIKCWYFQTKLWMMRLEWGTRTEAALSHSEATSNKLPVDQTHNGSSLEKTPEFERPCSGPVGPQTPALLVQWASPGIRGVPGARSQEVTWPQEIRRLGSGGTEKTEDEDNLSSCRPQGDTERALEGGLYIHTYVPYKYLIQMLHYISIIIRLFLHNRRTFPSTAHSSWRRSLRRDWGRRRRRRGRSRTLGGLRRPTRGRLTRSGRSSEGNQEPVRRLKDIVSLKQDLRQIPVSYK